MRRRTVILVIAIAVVTLALAFGSLRATLGSVVASTRGAHTVDSRLAQFGDAVHARLRPAFEAAGVPMPPARLAFVAFKDAKTLEVYARAADHSPWRHVTTYPILAASGGPGPKLREGDRQVPEGIYRVESLNPNSRFHVSLRLDYPNAFDRRMAKADGRTDLGGDIMIHGSAVSIGCLAIGDAAAEDLFALTADVGTPNVTVLISPTDFRVAHPATLNDTPPWVAELHASLRDALRDFPSRN